MRSTRSSPSGVFHSSSFGRGQLHTVLLWPISTAGTRSLPSSIRHRTRQSPTRYRQRPDRSAVSPLPRERGLSSFSSSDRYRTIRRASGASMAAGCFSARRESSILQSKTTPRFTKRGGGAALRKQPQQERHPPYRRCASMALRAYHCPSSAAPLRSPAYRLFILSIDSRAGHISTRPEHRCAFPQRTARPKIWRPQELVPQAS